LRLVFYVQVVLEQVDQYVENTVVYGIVHAPSLRESLAGGLGEKSRRERHPACVTGRIAAAVSAFRPVFSTN
jgi:hypothetical protein